MPSIYQTLTPSAPAATSASVSADPAAAASQINTAAASTSAAMRMLVAMTAQACQWDAQAIAEWCRLTGAPPDEVKGIVASARLAKERGAAWF
ncbi:hypothetical protein [Methylobacterium sp. 10]|uniref:hypothetical protein n=1 Tax=Methylobacterium sp. 10 TaxID=1101191 RepID=UPI000569C5B5|nr:hypothetical protein [Methylobacterium sp. 10]